MRLPLVLYVMRSLEIVYQEPSIYASVFCSTVSPRRFVRVVSRVVLPETGEGDCSWRWVTGYHSYLDITFRGGFSIMNLPASKLTSTSRSPVIGSIRQTTGSGLEKATPNKLIFS